MLAGVWLMTSLVIVNLQSVPSMTLSFVFFVSMLLLALRMPASRPIVAGVTLSIVTLACSLLQLASHQLHADQISTDLNLTVRVIGVPEYQERRLSFMASVLECSNCKTPLDVTNVKLSWYNDFPEVRAGEKWQLNARLKPPSSLRNPGGFDAVAWNLVKGVHARGYVRQAELATRLDDDERYSLSAIRQRAATRLQRLSSDDRYLGLLQALTVGVKSEVSDAQWDLLRDTGTAHLMAISGLHVGLMAGWAMFIGKVVADVLVRLVRWRFASLSVVDTRPFALAASLMCATLYAGLAGFELPTQRAVLMLSVWLIASLRFRFLPPLAGWCLALMVVLGITPLNLLSAGFWLSFGTVAILFYLHSGHQQKRDVDTSRWRAVLANGQSLGRSHVLLGIVLLPVSAWFFQSGSLIAPLANVIAVPWVAMVAVPMGLLTLLLSALSDAAAYPFLLMAEGSLHLLVLFLTWLDGSMLSAVVLTLPGPLSLIFVLVGLVVMLAPRGPGLRLLAAPLFLPAVIYNTSVQSSDGFEVHVLDVGQGLAALVYAGPQTLLFDTGGKVSSDLSMFEAVVVPYLHASGRRRIDTVVISHGDEDHAFGVKDVVRHFPDAHVYASQPHDLPLVEPADIQSVSTCVAGTQWSAGEVDFAFLHPAETDGGGKNNRSCVLMVYSGKSRVLLTGDIEAAAERSLLLRLGSIRSFPITMMTAPHHGSNTSSTQAFVDTFRPQYVVFPAGQRNRYGFPQSNVQLRYKQAGSEALITGREGALSFVFDNEGLSHPPDSWWASHRRFWHGIVNPDCWQQVAGESLVRRLLVLSQKGKTLCGK